MLFDLAFVSYLLAILHVLLYLFLGYENLRKVTNIFILIGLCLNIVFNIKLFFIPGNSPFDSIAEIMTFMVLSLNLVYWIIYLKFRRPLFYLMIAPFIVVFSVIAIVKLDVIGITGVTKKFWLYGHLPFIIFGTSLFFVSAFTGVIYFLQERQIKNKKFGIIYNRFPPLETINRVNNITLLTGFAFYTVGVVMGFLWAMSEGTVSVFSQPKIVFAMISWIIFGAIILLKFIKGLTPKAGAMWSILGFFSLLITYIVAILFLKG